MVFTETELKEKFGTRVYNLPSVPVDHATIVSARAGIRRMINRETYNIAKEVDPIIIGQLKDKVKRLRTIRNELKKHLKQL